LLGVFSVKVGSMSSRRKRSSTKDPDYPAGGFAKAVRDMFPTFKPDPTDTNQNIIMFLKGRYAHLMRLKLSVEVPDVQGVKDAMTKDYVIEKGLSEADAAAIVTKQVDMNKTTAATLSNDRYVYITGGERFDEVHEYVHIMAAKGGLSDLQRFKVQLNEGIINYFAIKLAHAVSVPVVPRYPTETMVVDWLITLLGGEDNAILPLYNIAFMGKVEEFFEVLGKQYNSSDRRANGKPKERSEKGISDAEATEFMKKMLKCWDLEFIRKRLDKGYVDKTFVMPRKPATSNPMLPVTPPAQMFCTH